MRKITIEIIDNSLLFKYRTNKPVSVNLLNTNVITDNELVFGDDYIKQNKKIVSLFICDLITERNVNKIVITHNDIAELIFDVFKSNSIIDEVVLKEDVNISYSLCEKLSKLDCLKKINCYAIPEFMIELLDKKNIKVESRSEILFTSVFMQNNNLTSYSKIYYKTNIRIDNKLSDDDLEDIRSFIKVNKYLKTIHIDEFNMNDLNELCNILIDSKRKNISIIIHNDISDLDDIEKLRILNKKMKVKKIQLTLVYSKDYLEKNYLKQIIFTTLKICAIIIFVIIASVMGYILLNNRQSEKKVEEIKEQLEVIMQEDIVTDDGTVIPASERTEVESYQKLLEVNSDSVGWLNVPGTKIDYPVVQTTDNSYYLNRNFNRAKDYNGWVFMDYRNNAQELDTNTIIYAHNRYYSGVMFGTLNNVTKKNWLNDKDKHTITFNSMTQEMKWKVFSIYNIEVTSDYLYSNFNTNEEYQQFINLIKGRSMYDFDTNVSTEDKIITLSTCLDNNRRLVLHAVLIKQ